MATVSDILNHALRLNRQRNVASERLSEALTAFNLMLKAWGDVIGTPAKEDLTLTAGTEAYTIGSGGDFDTTKPISIESAYIQDSGGTDHAVEIFMAPFNYDRVTDKDDSARPDKLYYDANVSTGLGKIYFNSAPSSAETFQLTSYKGISTYSATTDTIVQPAEWEEAMVYNLAVRLAPEYGMKLEQQVFVLAEKKRAEIETRNASTPIAYFDTAILRT